MTSTRRQPLLLVDRGDDIGEIRARANRLQGLCSELAAELSDLINQTSNIVVGRREEPRALLSVQDCAELLGLSRTTTFSLIRDGNLESIKVGARRLVPRAAVDRFVRASQNRADGFAVDSAGL
jgi:excisionase family DNA binding protein